MRVKICISLIFMILCFRFCLANPLPPYLIAHVSANPPEIGIWSFVPTDFSGILIVTAFDSATINDGVIIPENYGGEPFILDSTNTSGFTINSEGDFAEVVIEYMMDISFGQLNFFPGPIDDHPIVQWDYYGFDMRTDAYSFDFARPLWGATDIVINEVNAHGTWQNNAGFIELYNSSDLEISLSDWRIICDDIYEFPNGAAIPVEGFYVIDEEDFPVAFDMNYDGDNIYLIDNTSGNNYTGCLVDQVGWSSDHGENVSFMRFPDGDVDTTWLSWKRDFRGYDDTTSSSFENGFPTRGAANRHECPGFVVIGARADSIDDGTARIIWTNPIWDELYLNSAVVKSFDNYPETPDDGDIIYTGTDQQFLDQSIIPETPNYYTIFARNEGGEYSTPTDESRTYIFFSSTGVVERSLPEKIVYLSNYPNPFNAQTTILFSLEHQAHAKISIYDITGRLVEVLTEGSYSSGKHSIIWNAGDLPSGIYFANMVTGESSVTEKLVLLK